MWAPLFSRHLPPPLSPFPWRSNEVQADSWVHKRKRPRTFIRSYCVPHVVCMATRHSLVTEIPRPAHRVAMLSPTFIGRAELQFMPMLPGREFACLCKSGSGDIRIFIASEATTRAHAPKNLASNISSTIHAPSDVPMSLCHKSQMKIRRTKLGGLRDAGRCLATTFHTHTTLANN